MSGAGLGLGCALARGARTVRTGGDRCAVVGSDAVWPSTATAAVAAAEPCAHAHAGVMLDPLPLPRRRGHGHR